MLSTELKHTLNKVLFLPVRARRQPCGLLLGVLLHRGERICSAIQNPEYDAGDCPAVDASNEEACVK